MNVSKEVAEETYLQVLAAVLVQVRPPVPTKEHWRVQDDIRNRVWNPERSHNLRRIMEQIHEQGKVPR